MRQTEFGSIYILVLVLVLLSGAAIAMYYFFSLNKQQSTVPVIQSPLITPTPEQNEFVPGQISVGIKSGVRYGDVEQLIKSYKLKYKGDARLDLENKKEIPYTAEDIIGERPVSITVFVPEGEENKWIKIFESDPLIKYAAVNHYFYLQNE